MHRTLIEHRPRHAYEGKPRLSLDPTDKDEAGRTRPRDQRAFALPAYAIMWTMEDQTAAMDRGYFVERVTSASPDARVCRNDGADNRARVLPMMHGPYASDADVMCAAERAAFHRDAHAAKLLAFVEQQDRYGYSGAWRKAVERPTAGMKWYKLIKAEQRERARRLTEMGRAAAKRPIKNLT